MRKRFRFLTMIALLLAAVMITSCADTANPGSDTDVNKAENEPQEAEPVFSFAAMSDSHIGDENTEESMRRTLKYHNEVSGGELDAFVFSGDLTDTMGSTPSEDQIELFKRIFEEEVTHKAPLVYSLGPTHDLPYAANGESYRAAFRKVFGADYFTNDVGSEEKALKGARHIVVNGYHFFTVDHEGDENGFDSETWEWLKNEVANAAAEDPEKPFFVSTHVPDMPHIAALLADYPQAVCFTGHLHNSVAREDSISQDSGFTNIHCGGMNYYRVDGYNRFYEDPFFNLGNIREFAQSLYVEVYEDNTVRVTRLDGYNGAVIGEPWVISPGRYDAYTNERLRGALSTFEPESDLEILEIENSYLKVSFDAAAPRDAGAILYYAIEIYENTNGEYTLTQHAEISSREVFFPNGDFPELYYTYTFDGVDLADYAVAVTAYDCWGSSSNSLVYTNGNYDHSNKVTGNVSCEKRGFTAEEELTGLVSEGEQDIEFIYGGGDGPSEYTEGYSMAVRFRPSIDFKNVEFKCSSWGDRIGTLDFKLYEWQGDYAATVAVQPLDSYSLNGFKGSAVYNVFDDVYTSGEYLIEITSPAPEEGVGVYFYKMNDDRDDAYVSYENGSEMEQHIYFSWTNIKTCTKPYVPITEEDN